MAFLDRYFRASRKLRSFMPKPLRDLDLLSAAVLLLCLVALFWKVLLPLLLARG
jgi:hypothetical protein